MRKSTLLSLIPIVSLSLLTIGCGFTETDLKSKQSAVGLGGLGSFGGASDTDECAKCLVAFQECQQDAINWWNNQSKTYKMSSISLTSKMFLCEIRHNECKKRNNCSDIGKDPQD